MTWRRLATLDLDHSFCCQFNLHWVSIVLKSFCCACHELLPDQEEAEEAEEVQEADEAPDAAADAWPEIFSAAKAGRHVNVVSSLTCQCHEGLHMTKFPIFVLNLFCCRRQKQRSRHQLRWCLSKHRTEMASIQCKTNCSLRVSLLMHSTALTNYAVPAPAVINFIHILGSIVPNWHLLGWAGRAVPWKTAVVYLFGWRSLSDTCLN